MSTPSPAPPQSSVAIIGGGVAGLAAAVAAVERGFHVELFEQAPAPGGRAGSYHDVQADQLVDLSPHVAMGCCTNLLDFCRRTETADGFDRYATLHFFGPDGRRYDFAASRWLPAPLHLMPGLRRLGYLTGRERRAIGRAMLRLARHRQPDAADAPTMGQWLRRQKQPENAVRRFWAVVLESALGDTLDHVSVAAARKVFVDGFMATREAYEVLVPRIPLGEIWQRAGTGSPAAARSSTCARGSSGWKSMATAFLGIVLGDGLCRRFDHVVSAVSWKQLGKLLGPELLKQIPLAEAGTGLSSSPITAVHLWFDRPIMDLPHAALVGRLSQWVFQGSTPLRAEDGRHERRGDVLLFTTPSSSALRTPWWAAIPRSAARGARRLAGHLAGGRRGEAGAPSRAHAAGGRFFRAAGQRGDPAGPADADRGSLSRRRLDRHRLARHDGRRRAERLPGDRGPLGRAGRPEAGGGAGLEKGLA